MDYDLGDIGRERTLHNPFGPRLVTDVTNTNQ
jgi:hypothetical protein